MGGKEKAVTEAKPTEGARAEQLTEAAIRNSCPQSSHADSQSHPPPSPSSRMYRIVVFTELPGREGRAIVSFLYYSCNWQPAMIEFQLFARHCATSIILFNPHNNFARYMRPILFFFI